jgi:hypothetical protein
MAMTGNTTRLETGRSGRPIDPHLERALLRAMQGALRRSVVLLPLSDDEEVLQRFLEVSLGVAVA